jgi:hypothetical protein
MLTAVLLLGAVGIAVLVLVVRAAYRRARESAAAPAGSSVEIGGRR